MFGLDSLSFLFIQDLIGTIVFAISGALVARECKMDIFGMFILGFVTGMGGGTLRDMMIGSTPVFWMKQPIYILMIALAVLIAILFKKKIGLWNTWLLIFDAIGLGVFTIIGAQKALDFGLHSVIAVTLGTVTGCFGGLIRDILSNRVPMILHKELYATSSLLGGIIFIILRNLEFESNIVDVLTVLFIIAVRLLSVKYKIQLPKV